MLSKTTFFICAALSSVLAALATGGAADSQRAATTADLNSQTAHSMTIKKRNVDYKSDMKLLILWAIGENGNGGWVFDAQRGSKFEDYLAGNLPPILSFTRSEPTSDKLLGLMLKTTGFVTDRADPDLQTYYWSASTVTMKTRMHQRKPTKIPKKQKCPAGQTEQVFPGKPQYSMKHCWPTCPPGYQVNGESSADGNTWPCQKIKCEDLPNMLVIEGPNFCAYTPGVKQAKKGKKCPAKRGYTLVDDRGVCAWTKDVAAN